MPGRARALQARFESAPAACPLLRRVVDGTAADDKADHVALLAGELGRPTPVESLPAPEALEAAVPDLATAFSATATVVVRVRFLVEAHEHRGAALATVTLDAPLNVVSSDSSSGSGAVCLDRVYALELVEVQSRPAVVALAADIAGAPSDILVLGLA